MRRGATRRRLWYPVFRPRDYPVGHVVWLTLAPHKGWYEVLAHGRGEIYVRRLGWRERVAHLVGRLRSRR